MCLSLSLDHLPAETVLQARRETHHEFNPLAFFWTSPSPSQTFCGLPSSPWAVVTSRRLPAHLCSGMGGSGPLTHTSILQPIISCLPWLPSKPRHDRWISSQESSQWASFPGMPLLARFTNCLPPWTEWGGSWMGPGWFFLFLPTFYFPPLSPTWILWLFWLLRTTPYLGLKVSKYFQQMGKEQTYFSCAWVTKLMTHSYWVPKLAAHDWGLEGEATWAAVVV